MRTHNIKTFREFIEITDDFDFEGDLVIFRGQKLKGNLLPSIARIDPKNNTADIEKAVIEQLRLMGPTFLTGHDGNMLELLVLAQHYGLKTRLLDWTSNPLVALWFACLQSSSDDLEDAFVYAFIADNFQNTNVYIQNPFEASKTRAFQPKLNNTRIIAQHGWFTLHSFSNKTKAFVPLERNVETKEYITEIRIDGLSRMAILNSLEKHGINRKTLYPDLEGLCKYLNWKFDL
jgi:hypothetical protein